MIKAWSRRGYETNIVYYNQYIRGYYMHLMDTTDEAGKSPKRLLAHVARANPLWKETKDGDEVLVIFRAEDVYVSPNWYPSKHDFHKSPDLELPRGARARQALHQGQRTVRAWRGGATYANS